MNVTTRLLASAQILALAAALLSAPALAQTTDHSGHDINQMNHDTMMSARAEHMIEATGTVIDVYTKDDTVSLSHDAIPAISWPAMTMNFPVGGSVNLNNLQKGQRVQFTLHRAEDGSLPLVELCPTVSETVIAGLCAPGMNHGPDSQMMSHGEMNHHGMKH